MHIVDEILDAVRTNGYAVMDGFLTPDELESARAGLFDEFPATMSTSPIRSSTAIRSSTSSPAYFDTIADRGGLLNALAGPGSPLPEGTEPETIEPVTIAAIISTIQAVRASSLRG